MIVRKISGVGEKFFVDISFWIKKIELLFFIMIFY